MTQTTVNFKIFKKNERELVLTDVDNNIKTYTEKGKIITLFGEGLKFSIGEIWLEKKFPYKISSIVKSANQSNVQVFILKIAAQSKSTVFIAPMLGGIKAEYLGNQNLINCYLADEGSYMDYNKIILSYRFSGAVTFSEFESRISKHHYYDSEYEPDSHHINYVFNIPEHLVEDYRLFLDGKYSEFSNDYKQQILKFHNFREEGSTGGVLYKSKKRRETLINKLYSRIDKSQFPEDAELLSKPVLLSETFLDSYIIEDNERTGIKDFL